MFDSYSADIISEEEPNTDKRIVKGLYIGNITIDELMDMSEEEMDIIANGSGIHS